MQYKQPIPIPELLYGALNSGALVKTPLIILILDLLSNRIKKEVCYPKVFLFIDFIVLLSTNIQPLIFILIFLWKTNFCAIKITKHGFISFRKKINFQNWSQLFCIMSQYDGWEINRSVLFTSSATFPVKTYFFEKLVSYAT